MMWIHGLLHGLKAIGEGVVMILLSARGAFQGQ